MESDCCRYCVMVIRVKGMKTRITIGNPNQANKEKHTWKKRPIAKRKINMKIDQQQL